MFNDPFIKIFILLVFYSLILIIIKFLNIGRKKSFKNCTNACPDCSNALNRIKRKQIDKILFHISFRIFDLKRYSCSECGWEGLRWEDRYRPQGN